ncbi:MAG TPA: hypothetical protein VGL97_10485 [Bryobacteraceae bacterium]
MDLNPPFGPQAASAEEFFAQAKPDVAVEITTLNPASGEPAISHIRSAFLRKVHVITANKGPIAHGYAPEILPKTDLLATAQGTSNVILLHTDLMGTIGTVSIDPGSSKPPMASSAIWWISPVGLSLAN